MCAFESRRKQAHLDVEMVADLATLDHHIHLVAHASEAADRARLVEKRELLAVELRVFLEAFGDAAI